MATEAGEDWATQRIAVLCKGGVRSEMLPCGMGGPIRPELLNFEDK